MLTKADLDRWMAKAPPRPRAWRWICHPDQVAYWRRELPSCIEVVPYAMPAPFGEKRRKSMLRLGLRNGT